MALTAKQKAKALADAQAQLKKLEKQMASLDKLSAELKTASTPAPLPTESKSEVNASADALRKLTSGGTLNDAERVLLNMSPIVTDANQITADTNKILKDAEDAAKIAADADAEARRQEAIRLKAELDAKNKATMDPQTAALISQLQAQVNALTNATNASIAAQNTAALQAAKTAAATRESAIAVLTDRFTAYGLGSLAAKIKELAIDGATEATITLSLQGTDEYKTRFSANDARVKSGLKVLTPAEYLNLEDGYRQVLRSYGLKAFDTDEYVQQFIANDTSPAELSSRVVTAVQRVQNADPAVSKQLKDFYGINSNDMVAYVLDPQQQFQKIERQVAAAEIGVAGGRQGLNVGVNVAEQLASQGITQAEAQKGYATIADILPTADKLSEIYSTTSTKYGQTEAEQEVFNSLASAQRARQKLTALEIAQFGGSSGTSKTSLKSSTSGLI